MPKIFQPTYHWCNELEDREGGEHFIMPVLAWFRLLSLFIPKVSSGRCPAIMPQRAGSEWFVGQLKIKIDVTTAFVSDERSIDGSPALKSARLSSMPTPPWSPSDPVTLMYCARTTATLDRATTTAGTNNGQTGHKTIGLGWDERNCCNCGNDKGETSLLS